MMGKVKKGFRTSPSIRIPRRSAEKMQAAAAAAAAAADLALQVERLRLVCVMQRMLIVKVEDIHVRSKAAKNAEIFDLVVLLGEAVAMIDASSFGGGRTYRCLSPSELKRLEDMRDVCLGV